MLKQAFRSYIASFHPKTKKRMRGNRYYTFARYLFIVIVLRCLVWEDRSWTFISLLPVAVISWSNRDTRIRMEKPMFLCPMTYKKRKEYINSVLLIKIGVPMMLGAFLEMLWSFRGGLRMQRSILMMICYLSIGIAFHVYMDGIDKEEGKTTFARKDRHGKIRLAWMNHVVGVLAIYMIFCVKELEFIGLGSEFYLYVFEISTAVLLVLDAAILFTQYRDMVEQAVDYELAFRIPGNLKYLEEE